MNIDINMSNFFDVESLYVQVNNFKKVSFVIKKKPKKKPFHTAVPVLFIYIWAISHVENINLTVFAPMAVMEISSKYKD